MGDGFLGERLLWWVLFLDNMKGIPISRNLSLFVWSKDALAEIA